MMRVNLDGVSVEVDTVEEALDLIEARRMRGLKEPDRDDEETDGITDAGRKLDRLHEKTGVDDTAVEAVERARTETRCKRDDLVLRRIRSQKADGAKSKDLAYALHLTIDQTRESLKRLQERDLVHVVGRSMAARWFPGVPSPPASDDSEGDSSTL